MRRRSPWALPLLGLLVVALPILEVWLLIQVGQRIGVLPTVLVLVAEAVLGAWLLRREGGRAWRALEETFRTGRMPTGELADAALVLVGGVLLILPGLVTDVIGFLFLLPSTRPAARRLLAFFIARRLQRLGVPAGLSHPGRRDAGPTVIEGETVDAPAPARPSEPYVITGEIDDQPR